MSRVTLVAEMATGHGGDMFIAEDMVRAAADNGCDYIKSQAYTIASLNHLDVQRDWLMQSVLSQAQHERLMSLCATIGIGYLSSAFDAASLQMLRELGLTTFKIASSESGNNWWKPQAGETWFVSWPWGIAKRGANGTTALGVLSSDGYAPYHHLTAIPLYPTPLEAVGRATLLDGFSCHCEGLDACRYAIARGATVIEAHMRLPGRGRECSWDKTPSELRALRDFADSVETITSGVGQRFRERWKR